MVIRKQGIISGKASGLQMRNQRLQGGLVTRDNPDDFDNKARGSRKTIVKYDNPDDVDI